MNNGALNSMVLPVAYIAVPYMHGDVYIKDEIESL